MPEDNKVNLYKSHIKDTNKGSESKEFEGNNPQILFVYRKSERLTAAIYLVTDLFDDHEPLKWDLRTKAVSLLSFITVSWNSSLSAGGRVASIEEVLSSIVFSFELATRSNLISEMNFSLLKEEFLSLRSFLSSEGENLFAGSDFSFPENYFSYGDIEGPSAQSYRTLGAPKTKGHNTHEGVQSIVKERTYEESIKDKNVAISPKVGAPKPFDTKESRRTSILLLLKTKGEMTIKEIVAVVSGWSEKTIQRELMSLIATVNVLKKG